MVPRVFSREIRISPSFLSDRAPDQLLYPPLLLELLPEWLDPELPPSSMALCPHHLTEEALPVIQPPLVLDPLFL